LSRYETTADEHLLIGHRRFRLEASTSRFSALVQDGLVRQDVVGAGGLAPFLEDELRREGDTQESDR
jgi:hypothetical protein